MSQDERRRWAHVARRTIELGPGTSALVTDAVNNRPVPLPALHAAEACLDQLDAPLPGEPIQDTTGGATMATRRALEPDPTEAP